MSVSSPARLTMLDGVPDQLLQLLPLDVMRRFRCVPKVVYPGVLIVAAIRRLSRSFQSSPRPWAGCDCPASRSGPPPGSSFNPHPSRGQGATPSPSPPAWRRSGFNPHPARGQGATRFALSSPPDWFQSSPRPWAGCDTGKSWESSAFPWRWPLRYRHRWLAGPVLGPSSAAAERGPRGWAAIASGPRRGIVTRPSKLRRPWRAHSEPRLRVVPRGPAGGRISLRGGSGGPVDRGYCRSRRHRPRRLTPETPCPQR